MASPKHDIVRTAFGGWKGPVLLGLFEGLTHFGTLSNDSAVYVDVVKLLRGTATVTEAYDALHTIRIVRPVVPMLALPLSYVMSYKDAIATVNLGFVLLGTLFTYLFTKKLFGADDLGVVSAIAFASATPILEWGAGVTPDCATWAMLIIQLYIALFVLEERKGWKTALLAGTLFGVGLLTKEMTIVVLIFLYLRFFLHRRLKISDLLLVTVASAAIYIAWATLTGYNFFGFYGEGLAYGTPGYKGALVHPRLFFASAVYAFYLALPFAFMGFFSIDDDRFKTICEILFSVGAILLLWPTEPQYRYTFISFPAVLALAALGIKQSASVLAKRPWFRLVGRESWLWLLILVQVAYANFYALRFIKIP